MMFIWRFVGTLNLALSIYLSILSAPISGDIAQESIMTCAFLAFPAQ